MRIPVRQRGQATGRQGRSLVSSLAAAAPSPVCVPPVLPSYVRNARIVHWVKGGGCQVIYDMPRNP
jgi:hypothetical protein